MKALLLYQQTLRKALKAYIDEIIETHETEVVKQNWKERAQLCTALVHHCNKVNRNTVGLVLAEAQDLWQTWTDLHTRDRAERLYYRVIQPWEAALTALVQSQPVGQNRADCWWWCALLPFVAVVVWWYWKTKPVRT